MICTEEEAKTKWCPFSKEPYPGGMHHPIVHRMPDGHLLQSCIGSACMAWRSRMQWKINAEADWTDYQPFDPNAKTDRPTRVIGFCGLAGQP